MGGVDFFRGIGPWVQQSTINTTVQLFQENNVHGRITESKSNFEEKMKKDFFLNFTSRSAFFLLPFWWRRNEEKGGGGRILLMDNDTIWTWNRHFELDSFSAIRLSIQHLIFIAHISIIYSFTRVDHHTNGYSSFISFPYFFLGGCNKKKIIIPELIPAGIKFFFFFIFFRWTTSGDAEG